MVRPGRDALGGTVEIDESYVGGPEKGNWGREIESKAIVAITAEAKGRGIGRIRQCRIEDVSAASHIAFARNAVTPGATIHTDGWRGYTGLAAAGYRHEISIMSATTDPAHEVMPSVHNVASLLKRWLLGTHQGSIQRQHLDYYLDEFTFRFNRRRSNTRGILVHRPAEQAATVSPVPYRDIIGKPANPADFRAVRSVKGIPTSSDMSRLTNFHAIHSPYKIDLVLMDDGQNAFAIERQARALLVQHDWDLDDLHLAVVGHRLAEALMRDDHPGYRHWHEVYSSAVRLAATDDPILLFGWLIEHPELPIPDEQT